MSAKKIYGLGRSRDERGNIVKRYLNDYVNTIHTMVGGGYETMQVLVMEVYDKSDTETGAE